jgi:signal peptidase I
MGDTEPESVAGADPRDGTQPVGQAGYAQQPEAPHTYDSPPATGVTEEERRDDGGLPPEQPKKRQLNPVVELLLILVAALGLWYITNGWIVKPYRIPSASMEPTLRSGDRVLVARFMYRFTDPHRGDIIVFHPPGAGSQPIRNAKTKASVYFIKRIIGLPGETVQGRNGVVSICKAPGRDCRSLKEPYLADNSGMTDFAPVTVPQDQYFMMGDNRAVSDDSRDWGTLPRDNIIGEAFATYWPPDRLRTL